MPSIQTDPARDSRWEKFEIGLGIGAFLFFVLGVALDPPASLSSMTGPEVVEHFKDNKNRMFGAFVSIGLSAFCLLWFLGALRSRLTQSGVTADRLAATFFGSGIAFVALLLAGRAAAGAPSAIYNFGFEDAELDPVAASLLTYLAYDLWALAGITASACVASLSVAGKRTGILPRWITRTGYVAAVVALLATASAHVALSLVMLWVAAVSWSGLKHPTED